MAGGRGERLRPLTDTCPKPLLPVAGRPVLDRLLEKLAEAGIQDVTLAVGYLGQMIEDYVGDGARWGVRADYVRQAQPMGTAGALNLIADKSAPLLVINGDKVFELAGDIRAVAEYEHHLPAVGTVEYEVPCGVFLDDSEWGEEFHEKPVLRANAGIYRLSPFTFKVGDLKPGHQDMPTLLQSAQSVRLKGYVLDIGTPATYEAACARLS